MKSFRGYSFRYKISHDPLRENRIHNRIRIRLNNVEFESIKEAAESIKGLSPSTLSHILRGKTYKKWNHLQIERI